MNREDAHDLEWIDERACARAESRLGLTNDLVASAVRRMLVPGFADFCVATAPASSGRPKTALITASGVHLLDGEPPVRAGSTLHADMTHDGSSFGTLSFVRLPSRQPYAEGDCELARRFGAYLGAALHAQGNDTSPAPAASADLASTNEDFLALVSHELRTPLQAILGWASILLRGNVCEGDLHRGLSAIKRNAEAEASLVEALLEASRLRSGALTLRRDAVCVQTLVRETLDAARPLAESHGVELTSFVASDTGYVQGDAERLRQALWNVVSNALKFTPAGGRVSVSARSAVDEIEVSVEDSGVGIAPDFLPLVFGCFTQPDQGTTRASTGLGLGLSICRGVIELHGGRVEISSAGLGQGTTVFLRLPSRRPRPHRDSGRVLRPSRDVLGGTRVLFFGEDGETRRRATAALEEAGASVLCTDSSETAEEILWSTLPDVIVEDLTDANRDCRSPLECLRVLPGDHPLRSIPALAVGPAPRPGHLRSRSDLHGARLTRPLDGRELVAKVMQLVRDRSGSGR